MNEIWIILLVASVALNLQLLRVRRAAEKPVTPPLKPGELADLQRILVGTMAPVVSGQLPCRATGFEFLAPDRMGHLVIATFDGGTFDRLIRPILEREFPEHV